jgi:hypothetical protein
VNRHRPVLAVAYTLRSPGTGHNRGPCRVPPSSWPEGYERDRFTAVTALTPYCLSLAEGYAGEVEDLLSNGDQLAYPSMTRPWLRVLHEAGHPIRDHAIL